MVFKRPGALLERNRKQAEVPNICSVLKNERGTAPGMLFEKNDTLFISMPGVPHEMKGITEDHVLELLKNRFQLPYIGHRTLLTAGIGESLLAERIEAFETALPTHVKLAYLPNYGMVRLRLTAHGNDKKSVDTELDALFTSLQSKVEDVLVVNEDIHLEVLVGRLLRKRNQTIATAESCTGGYLAHLITSIPGSSSYFYGSVVSYDNSIKEKVLHVAPSIITSYGAVSEETSIAMLDGILNVMQTDYGIAITGIMGPGGGSVEKPVGTIWIALGNRLTKETHKLNLRFDRQRNIELTATQALNLFRQFILKNG